MADVSELFWQASLEDMKKGYVYQEPGDEFVCLICGKSFANGVIYPSDGQLYEARKYVLFHIKESHHSVFNFLLDLDKKITGLTDHQKTILEYFYTGHSDNEVAKALGAGSASTIRNHRFTLRERQKQAKVFLAIMELFGEQAPVKMPLLNSPGAPVRWMIAMPSPNRKTPRFWPPILNRAWMVPWILSR